MSIYLFCSRRLHFWTTGLLLREKTPFFYNLFPANFPTKPSSQYVCMIPRLDPDFFFSRERDPDPLTNYRSTPRFSPIWRKSYSCSYADSRPWLATCYNNVLTINLRFVTSSDILIYLRELLSRKILYSSSRSAAPGVKKLGLETCRPYKFFQTRSYIPSAYCIPL